MARSPESALPDAASPTNAPEISVSELSGALKRTIEDAFGHVRVRGEISGYRGPHSSGHVYFTLKDQNARIDAVIWKGVFGRLRFKPEEGMEVIATGKVSTFPGFSQIPDCDRAAGACRCWRIDGAAGGAAQKARSGGAV